MYTKSSSALLLLTIAASTVVAASPVIRPKGISILPIFECPDDIALSPVLVLPSIGGPPLTANQYIVCFQGKPVIFNCSEGLFFNPSILSCDFPYERSAATTRQGVQNNGTTSAEGNLDLLPVGPVQVPVSPQYPIPIWSRAGSHGGIYPIPPYPITKPDPSVIMPLPVIPAHTPPLIPRPVPYYYYY